MIPPQYGQLFPRLYCRYLHHANPFELRGAKRGDEAVECRDGAGGEATNGVIGRATDNEVLNFVVGSVRF